MTRRLALVSALVAVMVLLLAVTVPVASAATKTLHFTSPVKEQTIQRVDIGKKGPSLGDLFFVNAPLHKQGGGIAGSLYVACTLVKVNPQKNHCVGTLSLSGGQITFQGVINPPVFTVAVTGGTRAYQTARGQFTTRITKNTTFFTLHLIL